MSKKTTQEVYDDLIANFKDIKKTNMESNPFKDIKLDYIDSSLIIIDDDFQRKYSGKNVKNICKKFNILHMKPLFLFTDALEEKYYIVDGQHTLLACKHNGINIIPSYIIKKDYILSDEDITDIGRDLFISFNNGIKEKIYEYDKLKNELSSKDPNVKKVATEIFNIAADVGITMASKNENNEALISTNIKDIKKAYKLNPKYFKTSLQFIVDLFPNDKVNEQIVLVLTNILHQNSKCIDSVNEEIFLENLSHLIKDNDKLNCHQSFKGKGKNKSGLEQILDEREQYDFDITFVGRTKVDWVKEVGWKLLNQYNKHFDDKINKDIII